jgi:hypothetical protein
MLFNAMTLTLEARADTSKTIMYVLAGLLVFFFLIGMVTRRFTRSHMRRIHESGYTQTNKIKQDPASAYFYPGLTRVS